MVICVVVGCSKRSDRDKHLSFHRIPTARRHYGKRELELSIRRRDGYLAAISRENIDINTVERSATGVKLKVNGQGLQKLSGHRSSKKLHGQETKRKL